MLYNGLKILKLRVNSGILEVGGASHSCGRARFVLTNKSGAIDSIQAGENSKDLKGANEASALKKKKKKSFK